MCSCLLSFYTLIISHPGEIKVARQARQLENEDQLPGRDLTCFQLYCSALSLQQPILDLLLNRLQSSKHASKSGWMYNGA